MAKILIIDDSTFQRSILKKIVNTTSHEFFEVSDGQSAINYFTENDVDLIFCDLLMPGISGFDVLKKLALVKPNTPAIVITADIQESVRDECLELGAKKFLNKPVNKQQVLSAITELVG